MRLRRRQNAFVSSEIIRTCPKHSKTQRVCQKITSPLFNRTFSEKSFFHDFQLFFPAEIVWKNATFQNSKFWKFCKNLIFTKSVVGSFWRCFSTNLFVWSCFKHVSTICKPWKAFLDPTEAYFGQSPDKKPKIAIFWRKIRLFARFYLKCASEGAKMLLWARKSLEHVQNIPKLKGFVKKSLPHR